MSDISRMSEIKISACRRDNVVVSKREEREVVNSEDAVRDKLAAATVELQQKEDEEWRRDVEEVRSPVEELRDQVYALKGTTFSMTEEHEHGLASAFKDDRDHNPKILQELYDQSLLNMHVHRALQEDSKYNNSPITQHPNLSAPPILAQPGFYANSRSCDDPSYDHRDPAEWNNVLQDTHVSKQLGNIIVLPHDDTAVEGDELNERRAAREGITAVNPTSWTAVQPGVLRPLFIL
ncbi:hypothetical protein BDR05DRAFT_995684 [Suillus weaverae]|nr:hypothetical protein BDR05DRAFT_995684 [Suillus weaverae]